MERFFAITKALSTFFIWISGLALVCILFFTVADVIFRVFYRPITGVYDLTGLLGGVVIGLGLPLSIYKKVHVYMGFLVDSASSALKKILTTINTFCGIFLFSMFGWNLILFGIRQHKVGEVSGTLLLPFYPFSLVMGVSFLLSATILLNQWVAIFRKE